MSEYGAPPSIFQHACSVYNEMMKTAQEEDLGPPGQPNIVHVYTGYMTKLITVTMSLPIPYYTDITRVLQGMECARQVKRGGGSAPSRWALLREPTLELFQEWERTKTVLDDRKVSQSALQGQQINDLGNRITALEDGLQQLLEALADR